MWGPAATRSAPSGRCAGSVPARSSPTPLPALPPLATLGNPAAAAAAEVGGTGDTEGARPSATSASGTCCISRSAPRPPAAAARAASAGARPPSRPGAPAAAARRRRDSYSCSSARRRQGRPRGALRQIREGGGCDTEAGGAAGAGAAAVLVRLLGHKSWVDGAGVMGWMQVGGSRLWVHHAPAGPGCCAAPAAAGTAK